MLILLNQRHPKGRIHLPRTRAWVNLSALDDLPIVSLNSNLPGLLGLSLNALKSPWVKNRGGRALATGLAAHELAWRLQPHLRVGPVLLRQGLRSPERAASLEPKVKEKYSASKKESAKDQLTGT